MREQIKKLMPGWLLELAKRLRFCCIVCLFHVFHLFPIKKSRVVLCNVWGFGDNAKYVTEELSKRLYQKGCIETKGNEQQNKYEVIFITNHPNVALAPDNVRVLRNNSLRAIFALATARVWLDNNRKENYVRKRKGQYYIQTWHGGIALKKIEKDYGDKLGDKYIRNARRDSKMTDLYISNSNFCTNMYKKSFWYKGEILECGSPRNDILVNPHKETINAIRKRLGLKADVKLVIYAPTYREGEDNIEAYELDYAKIMNALKKRFGGEFKIALRLHPLVSAQSKLLKLDKDVIDATNYRDIYELMAVGDFLITDYSNIMFEFALTKKPVFLYALDEEEYEKERGFYFKYTSLPFARSKNIEELTFQIENYKQNLYEEQVDAFFSKLKVYEKGDASKRVADRILQVID